MEYSFINAEKNKYAIYYAVYASYNIYADFDWNQMVDSVNVNDNNGFFIINKEKCIGGFTLTNNQICHVFTIPPLSDRVLLWRHILKYALDSCGKNKIILNSVSEEDRAILTDVYNAKVICTERRMFRPTDKICVKPPENFYFAIPDDNDKQEIIQVVYEAHLSAGYDTIGTRGKDEVKDAVNRRFDLFTQTNTLNISTLVKSGKNNEIAGVCIAGVYPPAESDSFSTIHQVSVRPQFRRKGIAEAMMLNSINKAHSVSPVITLGVTVGNPAEILYNKIGFLGGPKSSELHFTV